MDRRASRKPTSLHGAAPFVLVLVPKSSLSLSATGKVCGGRTLLSGILEVGCSALLKVLNRVESGAEVVSSFHSKLCSGIGKQEGAVLQ